MPAGNEAKTRNQSRKPAVLNLSPMRVEKELDQVSTIFMSRNSIPQDTLTRQSLESDKYSKEASDLDNKKTLMLSKKISIESLDLKGSLFTGG